MIRRPWLRRLARIAGWAGVGLVAFAAVIVVGAPLYFRGERFGVLVEGLLPITRGHTHVVGCHWNWGTVISLVRYPILQGNENENLAPGPSLAAAHIRP